MRGTRVTAVVGALAALAAVLVPGAGTAQADTGAPVVVAWGDNSYGQTDVPADLADVVAVSAGTRHSLALKDDGTVVAWGDDSGGQTDVPADLTDVVAISAGGDHNLALKRDGTVVGWGGQTPVVGWEPLTVGQLYGYLPVPDGLSDVVAIEAGGSTNFVLKADGTTFGWGYNPHWSDPSIPGVAISLGAAHSVTLGADGIARGSCPGSYPLCRSYSYSERGPFTDVAAGAESTLGLRPDGTVEQWLLWSQEVSWAPAGLSGVVDVEAGGNAYYAVDSDGRLYGWAYGGTPITNMPAGLRGVSAVSTSGTHTLAIVEPSAADTTPPSASVAAPADGASYDLGQAVVADYSCDDDVAVASCDGPVPVGTAVDTSTPGSRSFTVTATDTTGNTASASASYTVSDQLAAGLALSGSFTSIPAGYDVSVVDEGSAGVTVSVAGSGAERVEMSVCGGFTLRIAPGSSVTLACGSVIATVHSGSVEVEVASALGLMVVQVPTGAVAEVDSDGSVQVVGPVPVTVTVGGVTQTVTASSPLGVRFVGFRQPVDNGGVLNTVKGGSAVPLKFEVFYGAVELTDPAVVASISAARITCPGGAPSDAVEELATTTGGGVRYSSGDGFFIANWKTPSAKGTCQRLTVTTTSGASLIALFLLR